MAKRALCLILAAALLPSAAAQAVDRPHDQETKPPQEKPASAVPEPGELALFAAGVVGLIIGQRSSRSRRRDD